MTTAVKAPVEKIDKEHEVREVRSKNKYGTYVCIVFSRGSLTYTEEQYYCCNARQND